ncbi:MAG: wax ester/triacylglycerol synthase family O-acyltransferase, partial [Pseudomonadota bacterium]
MRALSGLDTAFVYLENARSPMHIGGVYLLDAAVRAASAPAAGSAGCAHRTPRSQSPSARRQRPAGKPRR